MAKILTATLRESKMIASYFFAGSRRFFSGAAPVPPTEIIRPGYNFGREPFGPAYGIQIPKGSDGLPKYVNWLLVPNVVTQSTTQNHCGGCYIVEPLCTISSLNHLTNKSSVHLSAQHILDGNTLTNHGCEGGWAENVFDYIIRNGGVLSENDYPYRGIRGPCKVVEGVLKVPDEPGRINHSVVLLGYEEFPQLGEYWIGMNSFERNWGMKQLNQDKKRDFYCNIFLIPRNTFHVGGAVRVLSNVILPLGASMVPKVKARSESCPLFQVGGHT